MAKGQKRSNREVKKPKAAKKTAAPSLPAAQLQAARSPARPGGRKPS